MGRGRSGKAPTMAEMKAAAKAVRTAQTNYTRAEKAYHYAAGNVLVTPAGRDDLLRERQAKESTAYRKMMQARESLESAQTGLEKLQRRQRKAAGSTRNAPSF